MSIEQANRQKHLRGCYRARNILSRIPIDWHLVETGIIEVGDKKYSPMFDDWHFVDDVDIGKGEDTQIYIIRKNKGYRSYKVTIEYSGYTEFDAEKIRRLLKACRDFNPNATNPHYFTACKRDGDEARALAEGDITVVERKD